MKAHGEPLPDFIAWYRQLLQRVLFDGTGHHTHSVVAASLAGYRAFAKQDDDLVTPRPPPSLSCCLANLATATRGASDELQNELHQLLVTAPQTEDSIPVGQISSDILGHTLKAGASVNNRKMWSFTILGPLFDEFHARAGSALKMAEARRLADTDLCRLVALGAVITLELLASYARHGNAMLGRKQLPEDAQRVAEWDRGARELKKNGVRNIWVTLAQRWAKENDRLDMTSTEMRAQAGRIQKAVTRYRRRLH